MPQWSPSHSCSPMPTPHFLSHDKLHSHNASPAGPSGGKHWREHSPSEWHYKCQREESPGPWITHLFLPLVWHENHCLDCNNYAMHLGVGAAASRNGFRAMVEGLIDCAMVFSRRESSNDLIARMDCLRHQCDDLKCKLLAICEEITCLSWGSNIPQPSSSNDEAHQFERAWLASLGVPMKVDQHDTDPSWVPPSSLSLTGRVQTEPAAPHLPPTLSSHAQVSPATTTSSCKGKEQQMSPVPFHTVLLYEDIHMDDAVLEADAINLIQRTLFPEFMGKEPLKNIVVLGDLYDTKGVCTLFVRMGNYVYAY